MSAETSTLSYYHYNKDCVFYYFIEGGGNIKVEGKNYPVAKGDLILINPSELFVCKIEGKAPHERLVLRINYGVLDNFLQDGTSLLAPLYNRKKGVGNYIPRNTVEKAGIDNYLRDIYTYAKAQKPSSNILAICKAVGYLTGNAKMKAIDENGYTGTMVRILTAAGAVCLRDSKYLTSDKYLKRGDILLNEQHHTAINLTNGSAIKNNSGKVVETKMQMIQRGSKGRAVYVWQAILGFKGSDLDGDFGSYTEKKTKEFQKAHDLEIDGIVGDHSWKAGLESV
jgi:peptidoglycan hydrolase-like protein with peptidoglycan-binding domain